MPDTAGREVAEPLIAARRKIRHRHQAAQPLAEVRPDPLADAFARKALQAEAEGAWLLRNGVHDDFGLLFRASNFEATARFLRRQEPIQ